MLIALIRSLSGMNLLSGEKEDDNLICVVSTENAQELMEITFGNKGRIHKE